MSHDTGPHLGDEPLWMLRVNPLRRTRLADPALRRGIEELSSAEAEVRELAARCSDALYELIGAAEDREARGPLIALRRAIHNDSTPRAALLIDHPDVASWQRARARRDAAREQLGALYDAALVGERGTLAGLLSDGDLRCSMALVAPDAAEGAERYVEAVTGSRPLTARLRKSERGLVQYVTRAMVRTSPMARFTAVGLAIPEPDGPPLDAPEFGRIVPRAGLDRVMLDYVLGGLHTSLAGTGPDTLVQLPPTSRLSEDGTQLRFLRYDEEGAVRQLSAKVSPVVRLLLDATALGPRRVADVVSFVAERARCSPEQALKAVGGGLKAGILCTRALPEDTDADLVGLLESPLTTSEEAAGIQSRVRGGLAELAASEPQEQPATLRRLTSALSELSRTAQRPATIVVEEDTALEGVRLGTEAWRTQLDDLAAGVSLLSAFDLMHDVRALLVAAFVDRFGAGADVSLTENAEYLVNEMYRRGLSIDDPTTAGGVGPADGSLDRLYALRESVSEALNADLTEAAEEGRDVVWSSARAAEAVAAMPDRFRRDVLTYGVLVQPWQDKLLFNNAYAGHGMLYGRFLGADRDLGGRALPHLAARLYDRFADDDARLVEDLGLHRLNVNAHPQVLKDGLRPDDWFALRLVHDAETDSLEVRDADGRPLRILTLGTGHPEMFPHALRLANWLTAGGELRENLVGHWHAARDRDARRTQACPRFSVGSAMLSRRRWYGGEELDRALAAGPGDPERLSALTGWRDLHGVPEEVVLKSLADGYPPDANSGRGGDQSENRRQKPQYVDLASALSVRVLPQMLQRRDASYLEEALPRVTDGPHAMEWVVEIGRTAGGPFQYGGKTL